jgi:branched-chain amino acid transport system permease protein
MTIDRTIASDDDANTPVAGPATKARMVGGIPVAWQRTAFVIAVVIAIALPFLVKNFTIFQLTTVMIYAIAILGLNLLTGYNGQFSLGHSTFIAIGAYTTAILMEFAGLSFYGTLPIAATICFAFGFLFGLPALRLESIYLALATFALAVATPQVLKLSPFEHWTGGVQGLLVFKPEAPFGLPLNSDQWMYFVTLAIGLGLAVCAVNLVNSRSGRAIKAIRDNPIAARAMGINISLYKTTTFGISAAYAGIAGSLSAVVVQFVAPDSFTFVLAIGLFVGLVVGGVGSITGALFGGLFLVFVPNIAEEVSKGLAGAVYGVILLLVIYLMPAGAVGLIRTAAMKLATRRR